MQSLFTLENKLRRRLDGKLVKREESIGDSTPDGHFVFEYGGPNLRIKLERGMRELSFEVKEKVFGPVSNGDYWETQAEASMYLEEDAMDIFTDMIVRAVD